MVKQNTFCKNCLYEECICDNYIYCDECGKSECDGVHSLRKKKEESDRIDEIVNYLLSNNDILDKVLLRLNEVRITNK
jgi:hypothetical protein